MSVFVWCSWFNVDTFTSIRFSSNFVHIEQSENDFVKSKKIIFLSDNWHFLKFKPCKLDDVDEPNVIDSIIGEGINVEFLNNDIPVISIENDSKGNIFYQNR